MGKKAKKKKSKANAPRNNINQSKHKEHAPSKEGDRSSPVARNISSENSFNVEPTPSNTQKTEDGTKYGVKWWKDRLEIIGIIGGIAVVILIGFQSCEMVKTTHDIETQIKDAKESRNLDERAWVNVSQVKTDFSAITAGQEPVNVSFRIPIKNTGKTPAINVVILIGESPDIKLIPKFDTYPNPLYNSSFLAPQTDSLIETTTADLIHPYDNIYTAIKSGKPYFIVGTVWYDDIFGNHHWTQFCYKLFSNFKFTTTSFHNSCDDVEANQKK